MLLNHVITGNTQIDTAFSDECGNVGGRQEDQCNVEVLNESNIQSVLSPELDVGAFEEVECRSIKTSLCYVSERFFYYTGGKSFTLGNGKQQSAF